ncbi:MAG: hypothetical protein ACRDNZ_15985 [Streptosporangiaceae bacterium]
MSGEAHQALARRLATFRASGDPGVVLDRRALVEVAVLRASFGWPASGPLPPDADIRPGLDAAVTAGEFLWTRSQLLPPADRVDDVLEATELLAAARAVAPRSVPRPMARTLAALTGHVRAADHGTVHDQAIDVLSAATRDGDLPAVDHAILRLSCAARAAAGDRDHPYYLSDLGTAWLNRFRITGRPRDLDNSVATHERALATPVPVPEDQAGRLANYGAALLARFEQGGDVRHLDDAIAAARLAVSLALGASEQPDDAGTAHPAPGPADERTTAIRLARLASLSRLSAALLASFEHRASEADLDEAVRMARQAAGLAPAGDAVRLRHQASLAYLLRLQAAHRTVSGAADGAGIALRATSRKIAGTRCVVARCRAVRRRSARGLPGRYGGLRCRHPPSVPLACPSWASRGRRDG